MIARLRSAFSLAPLLVACTAVVDIDVGAGIGSTCQRDDQCQGSSCLDGICTRKCADDSGCPGGTTCAGGICELPMEAGFIYRFPIAQDELAQTLDAGREAARVDLGYLATPTASPAETPEDDTELSGGVATALAAQLVEDGASVIVATATAHTDDFLQFADANPDVLVLAFQAPETRSNFIRFDARTYQAYYLAGVAAGRRTATGRLGIIGSVQTPPIVAQINAFALGAKDARGAMPLVVEVAWMGDWHDLMPPSMMGVTRERTLTLDLIARGADVVAHTLDNNAPAVTVAQQAAMGAPVWSVAALSPGACDGLGSSCIGSAFFQWGPYMARLLAAIHREELQGAVYIEGIQVSQADSVVGFQAGPALTGAQATEIDGIRGLIAAEEAPGLVFEGPIDSAQCTMQTGASPCVAEGDRLDDADVAQMCWFVPEVVDAAAVPAIVPPECLDAALGN